MCRVIVYSNPHCRCRWLQVYIQCEPNAGFSLCPAFGKHKVSHEPQERESLACPVHDLYGCYDRNFVRMIVKEKSSMRVGLGPSKNDPGFDIRCNVM